ncbi:MAG: DUF624 domain-containing protein [Chloroflexota bacterium]|nr:DUF624 domain-containing protein [Chloroflexota bacterium]MDE2840440.1 DUF624 domain-containing protein [Chloroflexota bacterium]MDE2932220.1 DUF624 domain-containing protein [Chloroflexota bacterium]
MLVFNVWRRALGMHYFEFFTVIRGNILWALLCLPYLLYSYVALLPLLTDSAETAQDAPPIFLGISYMIASLVPLTLAGPATAALYDFAAKNLAGEAVSMQVYVQSFRTHFIRGYLVAALDLLILAALVLNTWFYLTADIPQLMRILSILFFWGIVFWVAIQPYLFSVMIRLDTSVLQTFRNAVLLALDNLGVTISLIGVQIVMLFFFIPLIAIAYPVLGGSIFAHTHVGVLNELLDQYDAKRSADEAAQSDS